MAGDWDSADLTGLLTVFAAHVADLVPPWLQRLRTLAVRRQPPADRRPAAARAPQHRRHYDLSNELFALFLDETMTYSSRPVRPDAGRRPGRADGPRAKRSTARSTGCSTAPGSGPAAGCSRSAPAGANWPSAPRRRGATCARSPCPREQRALAARRVAAAGLSDRVSVDLRDYRDVDGRFDADLLGRDDRGGRRAVLGRPTSPPLDRAPGARAAGSGCRPSRCRTTGCWPPATPTPGSTSTSSPAACSRRSPRSSDSLTRDHAADHRARGLRRALRRDAADLAGAVRRAGRRGRPRSASTRCSTGCGASTCATPRPASGPATSTSASSPWPAI